MNKSSTHKKVLLVNPPRINGVSWTREGRCQEREDILGTVKPPFSLALIASILRENKIDFKLIDATAHDLTGNEIYAQLIESNFHPDFIVYCTTTPTIIPDTEALSILKKRFNAKLAAFGTHIASVPEESMTKLPDIDIGITGEPEYVVLDILKQDNLSDLSSVKGIIWRNGEKLCLNARSEWLNNLDRLPVPAWDLLPLDNYTLPFTNERYILVETSRGCPFGCEFCVAHLNHGLKFRKRQPENVVNEIEDLKIKFNINYFYLWGDTVTLDKKFIENFCDELIKRDIKIRWFTNTRADTLHDADLVRKMKASGCWMLSIGIESSSQETRRDMNKKLETDNIKQAITLLRKVGILSFGFFIYGYPGETEKDLRETTKFALSLPLDYANFYPAVPYPGTAFYNRCVRDGYLSQNSWAKMEYSHYILNTKDLNENIVKRAIFHAYRRFYLRPQFIYRHLRNIGLKNFIGSSSQYVIKFIKICFFDSCKQTRPLL